jgi:hypothetical protein
MEQFVAAQM